MEGILTIFIVFAFIGFSALALELMVLAAMILNHIWERLKIDERIDRIVEKIQHTDEEL